MHDLPLILLVSLAAQDGAREGGPTLRLAWTVEPPFALAAHRALAVDARPGAELVALGVDGLVRTWAFTADGPGPARGELRLAEPAHAVFAFAPLSGAGKPDLFVASPRGLEVFRADDDGAFAAEPLVRAPRARLKLRTSEPVAAPLAVDVDGDGRTDAVLPDGDELVVWLQRAATGPGNALSFGKGASVHVPISSDRATGGEALSDTLRSAFTIPSLRRVDVNGDGRLDLVVEDGQRRAFHLVRPDGTIPHEPDSVLDLSIFRDTTPAGEIAPGRTLAGLDRTLHEMRDLDGDGIPDHVIAHRRKVWVFHGSHDAPRFETPTSVLKTADDVTALLLLDLDGDARPDLVLVKLQVPSVAAILKGLVSEWEIDVSALGYRGAGGDGGRDFEPTPAWRSQLALRVPAILSILKDPDAIVRRFEDAGRKLRASAEGDLDGDGRPDVALVSEDGARLEVWRGDEAGSRAAADTPEVIVRRVLFEDPDTTWDLDRLVAWLSGFAERRVQALTGGRAPDAGLVLRAADAWRLTAMETADLDGDGRAEVVLRYDAPDGARSALDCLRLGTR